MFSVSRWSFAGVTLLTAGLAAGAIAPFVTIHSSTVLAQPNGDPFPDIQGHWARPFIRVLANEGIVRGYLDGTYRPEQAVSRDEFAALVNQAFDQEPVRQIEGGSVYQDVPEGYWADEAIEAAYQQGFMTGYPGGFFQPNQPIAKVDALMSLSRNLNLPGAAGSTEQATSEPTSTASETARPATRRQATARPLMFPLAMTALMQPVLSIPQEQSPTSTAAQPDTVAATQTEQPQEAESIATPASRLVADYYVDADQIPQHAVGDVAAATEAGLVVNHPEPNVLEPNQPVSRGEMAAILHQALVYQNRLEPLPAEEPAANYIVGR
jgi:hypothetical protein